MGSTGCQKDQFSGEDEIDLTTAKFILEETVAYQEDRCGFDESTIAFPRKGSIGEMRLLPTKYRFALLDSVCVVKPSNYLNSVYVNYCLRGETIQRQVERQTHGVALKQVSIGAVRSIILPFPFYRRAKNNWRESAEVIRRWAPVTRGARVKINRSRKKQTVLASAFSGKIVNG